MKKACPTAWAGLPDRMGGEKGKRGKRKMDK